jgi:hypothetical protein
MRYVIYCDESEDKGRYFSNFYGGALLRESDRLAVEAELNAVKLAHNLKGEVKWTKISEYNEAAYIALMDKVFEFMAAGLLKVRIMFTQNINQVQHLEYEDGAAYFKLYYQFIKHAFGLEYCNPERANDVSCAVLLDDAPDTAEKLAKFKDYLAGLSLLGGFLHARISFAKADVAEVESGAHVILQMVDVILGSMQFRLNEHHRDIPEGKKRRGKRTRAKERVYKHINKRIRGIYPGFNIGASTGHAEGIASRWLHPYRHWNFEPRGAVQDHSRGKHPK